MTKPPKKQALQAVQPKWQNVPESRRRIMRAISRVTLALNEMVTEFGNQDWLPFRVCRKDLPGCPDIVFPRLRKLFLCMDAFARHDCAGGPDPC